MNLCHDLELIAYADSECSDDGSYQVNGYPEPQTPHIRCEQLRCNYLKE